MEEGHAPGFVPRLIAAVEDNILAKEVERVPAGAIGDRFAIGKHQHRSDRPLRRTAVRKELAA